jgi:hypothetical protein
MPDPNKPTPTRPAPPLAEVRRLLDRYRRAETPRPRRGAPPVLSPAAGKRRDH